MANYNDFKAKYIGKATDVDGYYGAQCWDLYAAYARYLGYPICHCTTTGYVQDIWTNRKSNGILNNFTEVTVMQPGDVAVFKNLSPHLCLTSRFLTMTPAVDTAGSLARIRAQSTERPTWSNCLTPPPMTQLSVPSALADLHRNLLHPAKNGLRTAP